MSYSIKILLERGVYFLCWLEMRVDDWGFWVVVGVIGFSREVVGGE